MLIELYAYEINVLSALDFSKDARPFTLLDLPQIISYQRSLVGVITIIMVCMEFRTFIPFSKGENMLVSKVLI